MVSPAKIVVSLVMIICVMPACNAFKLGIENISEKLIREFKLYNIALVTNQTGKDQLGRKNIEVFNEKGIAIKALFAPEHGIEGLVQAGELVTDAKDKKLHIPIFSLYGHGSGKKIDGALLKDIDMLFFDIQDSGMRHYTYISTLYQVLEAAAEYDKKVVVFDRPNPLGMVMEGPLVDPALKSFISIAEIPLRHGMTMGELADYFNNFVLKKRALLTIVPMKDYQRTMNIAPFHSPLSPNITTIHSCFGYSFLGLLGEIKPFHVGIGTEHAFQVALLPESLQIPDSVWIVLAAELKAHGIEASAHRVFSAAKNQHYTGLRISVGNINQVIAFSALLTIVSLIKKAGIPLEFSASFDKASGSPKVREYLNGLISYQELTEEINMRLQQFFPKAQSVFKYLPKPELHFI